MDGHDIILHKFQWTILLIQTLKYLICDIFKNFKYKFLPKMKQFVEHWRKVKKLKHSSRSSLESNWSSGSSLQTWTKRHNKYRLCYQGGIRIKPTGSIWIWTQQINDRSSIFILKQNTKCCFSLKANLFNQSKFKAFDFVNIFWNFFN